MAERIPPHNEEAEKSVLGAVMLNREVLFDVLEEVDADDFYNAAHKEIFNAIWELYKQNKAVDVLTVSEELKKRGVLQMVGGRAYVAQLTLDVPSTINAVEYAKIVREKATIRKMVLASEDITDKGYQASMDAKDILDYAEKSIFSIAQRNQKSDYTDVQSVLLTNIQDIDEAAKNQGKVLGTPTGFKDLDDVLNGLQKSNLVIIAARPAMGKTAFALNIAQQSAVSGGSSVLIFSLEMSKEQLGQRLLSSQSRVEMTKLQRGNLDKKDWERVNLALDEMQNAKIHIDDTPGISMVEIRNKCRRLKADKGLDLILIDYLQLMSSPERSDNRVGEISAISRNLKLLAREMDCPVVALSQLSRAPEQRPDHHPNLADLRESGSIEQDADVVMFLYRDDYYNKENSEKPGVCEINIAKNRSGPTKTIELTWVSRYTKFSDMAL
ncbi:MAG: replicative DNA helicase [Clostridiales bacterium]|nr:replicative DNA helicase [Clostridiales bacterium]